MSAMASQITCLTICLLNRLFKAQIKEKKKKLRVIGLCAGKSPVTGEFPAQRASNAENASNWWRHHERQAMSNNRADTVCCWDFNETYGWCQQFAYLVTGTD